MGQWIIVGSQQDLFHAEWTKSSIRIYLSVTNLSVTRWRQLSPVQGTEPVFPVEFQGHQDPGQAIDRLKYTRGLALVDQIDQVKLVKFPAGQK